MIRRILMGAGLVSAVLVAVVFGACGGDDDDGGSEGDGATVAAPTSSAGTTPDAEATTGSDETPALSTPIAEGTDVSVERTSIVATASDGTFSLDVDSVAAGSILEVTFNNEDTVTHTLTFYKDPSFGNELAGGDSGETPSGETSAFQLTDPVPESGDIHFRCEIHSTQMTGTLRIE